MVGRTYRQCWRHVRLTYQSLGRADERIYRGCGGLRNPSVRGSGIPDEAMSDQAHEWTDEQIANLSAKIREAYEQAAREMEQKLGTWLSDYDRERMVMEERMRQGYITYTDYKKWLEDMAMERSWQQAMVDSLTNDAVNADVMCRQLINDELPTIFAENANFGAYDVDTKLGYDTGFTLVDRDTVMRLIKDNPELLPAPEIDKPKDTRWNRSKFASAVTQGVLQGESVPRMAQRLRTVFGMDERASVRSARTSFTSAENAGRINSYERAKRLGIRMQQEWLATLDMRTRHTHRLLDGQRVPVGGYFEPDGYGEKYRVRFPADPQGLPEMVWNCRCTLVAAVAGVDTSDADRWSKLPEGMTYDEWKGAKKEGENSQKAQEKKPTVEELRKSLDDRERALKDALRVRKPNANEERWYRNEVEKYKGFMNDYAHAKDYDEAALTARSMDLENQYYELGKVLENLGLNDPKRREIVAQREELDGKLRDINKKLYDLKTYNRYQQRYKSSVDALEQYLSTAESDKKKYEDAQASIPTLIRERNAAIKALSEAQPFGPQVREKIGDEFADAMADALDKATEKHPAIAAMYRMFGSKLNVIDHENNDGAYYRGSSKGIWFNAAEDVTGSSFDRPYEVIFHEFAHLIDNVSQYQTNYLTGTEDLRSVIMSDWANFRNALGRADGVTRDKNGHAIRKLRTEMYAAEDGAYAYASLSDIIEGCTRQSCPLGYGHGVSYHRQDGKTAREFFAEVCSAAIVNERSYEQMRRVFPNAVTMVESMIEGMIV